MIDLPLRPARLPERRTLLAGATLLLLAASAAAQPIGIDFSQAPGEDSLIGGPAVSGGLPHHPERWRGELRYERASRDGYGLPRYQRSSPSVIVVAAPQRSSYFRGTGVFANAQGSSGSVIYRAAPQAQRPMEGPRLIDVAAERLDRQPIAPGGIAIHRVGTAKIIRIASRSTEPERPAAEKDMAPLPEPAEPPATVPAPLPEPRPATVERAAPRETPPPPAAESAERLEPWTDEWLADCVTRHESFDASLGTYLAADGRRRFCTGEED